MEAELLDVRTSIDDMEKYFRRNCLKFSGIHEEKNANTDEFILNIVNKTVLKDTDTKLAYQRLRKHKEWALKGTVNPEI